MEICRALKLTLWTIFILGRLLVFRFAGFNLWSWMAKWAPNPSYVAVGLRCFFVLGFCSLC